ncbi:MAG: hypothetical protein ABI164_04685 [Acidobacteriaceae bacterium]
MLEEKRFRSFATGVAMAAALAFGTASLHGQAMPTPPTTDQPAAAQTPAQQNEAPSITPSANDTTPSQWSDAQLVLLTVSQAWRMSGRNEEKFFDIVQQLAAVSAKNRGLVLPDTAAAGQEAGQSIKKMAKADHQQLLYEIVDKAVREVGTPAPQPTSAN